ncbi:type II toxin-antitoxin system VapC family toxin [Candidatus Woesearchaeota archaeon]|nr:type II toxin-antitoxin system VapC family toxin [Candidatus Woesearchaeota archaeon]
MKYVLDTSTLIGLERGNKAVIERFGELVRDENIFYTTTLNIAEFYYGYAGKSKEVKKTASEFLNRFKLLTLTLDSARNYAELAYLHDREGEKVEDFDLLTVAIAIDNNATIITLDKGFGRIRGAKTLLLQPHIPKA